MNDNNLNNIVTVVKDNPDNNMLKNNPELKQYLICIAGKDGGDDMWEIVTGRTEAYEYVKENIDFADLDRSFILVETCILSKRKSLVAFIRHVKSLFDDDFDIDEYVKNGWDEHDYIESNNIGSIYSNVEPEQALDMVSILNGSVNTISLDYNE